ncbi:MAG: hypothetical protein ACHQFW_05005 [Chitinophagales bacterium]
MGDFIGPILMLLFWIFIVNGIVKFVKKIAAAGKNQNQPQSKQSSPKPTQTFQDIFKELQKKMEDAQSKQNVPPYATLEEIKKQKQEVREKRKEVPIKQAVYTYKESIPEKEKKAAQQYEQFVKDEKKKEHDAEQSKLFKKVYEIKVEEEPAIAFELDIRNALIGSMIFERPYQ